MIVIFLALLKYAIIKASEPTKNWILEVKNENGTDEIIEVRPGVLTKVILVLKHESNKVYADRSFDRANHTIYFTNSYNLRFYPNEIISIIPSLSLEYVTYIGLNCNYEISDDCSTFDLIKKDTFDLIGNDCLHDHNLKLNPVKVKINDSPTLIDIEPIETVLPARGYSLFKIKNEIYNIIDIPIKSNGYNNELFQIDNIEIKPFFNRKIFGKEKNDNHGILFDHQFGTLLDYQSLKGQNNISFNLEIDLSYQWFKRTCFELSPKSKTISFMINDKKMLSLNESIKEAILYSMENVTPNRDKTNNIQIKMDIPVAPIILKCNLKAEGEVKDEEKDNIEYKDYIINSGQTIIKLNHLNSNNEYKGVCVFSSITFNKTEFNITMGNDKEKDFISRLSPSKSSYGTPQCLEFTLTSSSDGIEPAKFKEQIKIFSNSVSLFCNQKMTEDESVTSRIMGNIICEKSKINIDDQHNKNKTTICIGISPNYNSENIKEEEIEELNTYFSEHVDNFIKFVNKSIKTNDYYKEELLNLELLYLKRYYDSNQPDVNKIKLELIKDDEMTKSNKLNFRINSSNNQPIECFYNEEMRVNDTKRFLGLYHTKEDSKSIILYPNEEKSFETQLEDYKEKSIYTLYMNCYNLPGARIRYEQTGIFTAYTLYTDIEGEQNDIEKQNITINCDEKKNKLNPYCLKGSYNNLKEMIKTKIPETDINEDIDKYSKLSIRAKIDYLNEIFKNFDEEIGKINKFSAMIQNIINKEKYLINTDCSIYVQGISNNNSINEINHKLYKNCRNNKKSKQKKIIEYLKNNFNCQNLSLLISKNGLSNNVEENIKYVILLVEEITNNVDTFTEGDSGVLLNIITCIQENYEDYCSKVQEYLESRGTSNITISSVKEDISNLLINSMANLVKILHFDEIDNYISEDEKNITSNGLMASKKGKKIHKTMKQFVKHFNEFGDGLYNLSDSLIINITINDDYKEESLQEENEIDEKAIKYEDKGIILLLHPQSMMKQFNAYAMQIIYYDSPLISIEADDNISNNILNIFIGITLYDNKGNEIKVDKIPENIRPKILYDKVLYKYMNNCYFYNEDIEDLSEKGVVNNNNYKYEGNEYLKCTAEHLTCFTAGQYFSKSSSSSNNSNNQEIGIVTIIILGSIFAVILIIVIIIIIVKRKRRKNDTLDDNEKLKKQMIDMELFERE